MAGFPVDCATVFAGGNGLDHAAKELSRHHDDMKRKRSAFFI
jgi:hypothetical protein